VLAQALMDDRALIVDAYLYLSISESIACPIDVAVSHE